MSAMNLQILIGDQTYTVTTASGEHLYHRFFILWEGESEQLGPWVRARRFLLFTVSWRIGRGK